MRMAAVLAVSALLASAGAAHAQAADTATVFVRGAIVVACWKPVAQADVDHDEELATVLDDFSWHWSETVQSLRAHDVVTDSRASRWVKLATGGRLRLVRCPRPVGYVFAAPGRLPKAVAGVATADDLLRTAAAYFRRPELARKEEGDGRHR